MKVFSLFIIISFATSTHASRCVEVNVISHFNKLGESGTFYGNEIHKGVIKAKEKIKGRCYKVNKLDIGPNLLTLRKNFNKFKSKKPQYYIGLGSSNKVKAILPLLGKSLLFSPTATSNEFKNNKNVYLTSGINEEIAKSIASYVNKKFKNVSIIYDIKNIYSIDLMKSIKKHLNIKSQEFVNIEDSPKAEAVILLFDERHSAEILQQLDKSKKTNIVIGADMWGPKKIYINKILDKISYIDEIRRFFTYKNTNNFNSDLMYYSYESLMKLNEMLDNCETINSVCLNKSTNALNYTNWPVKNEKIY